MSDSVIERLRHHAQDERNTAFARSTMREVIAELAASREREARMREALWQLLDDMGETGLCVCLAAKEQARAALAEGAKG